VTDKDPYTAATMTSKAPSPSAPPPGVPSSGGAKYVVVALLLLVGIGGAVAWKMSQGPARPDVMYIDASAPPPPSGRNLDDDVPPPPPVEEAKDAGKTVAVQQGLANQCDAKKCGGSVGDDLNRALAFRGQQARKCYNNALAQDATLKGKVTITVRVGSNGQVCTSSVATNELNAQVGACAANAFRGANLPAPKGGCADVNVPLSFVPGQ